MQGEGGGKGGGGGLKHGKNMARVWGGARATKPPNGARTVVPVRQIRGQRAFKRARVPGQRVVVVEMESGFQSSRESVSGSAAPLLS